MSKVATQTKAAKTTTTAAASADPPAVSDVASQLRTIESLAVDAREQLGIVLLDLFDREHATEDGMVLYEPLAPEAVAALRQTVSGLWAILAETRTLLRANGAEPDLEGKFALPSVNGGASR